MPGRSAESNQADPRGRRRDDHRVRAEQGHRTRYRYRVDRGPIRERDPFDRAHRLAAAADVRVAVGHRDSIAAPWPLVTRANGDDVTWISVVEL